MSILAAWALAIAVQSMPKEIALVVLEQGRQWATMLFLPGNMCFAVDELGNGREMSLL